MENNTLQALIQENPAYRNIIERTSVRRFTEEPLTELQKQALLHAAMSAPSGVNKQPWEFILVDDKKILQRLADALPYAKMTAQSPLAIIVCGNPERFLEGEDSTLWEQDLSAASENILLAARALDLGAVWTCLYPHADRIQSVREILGISDAIIPFNLIPVGHPAINHTPMDKWRPERVHHNKF
ncbi:MAG: nitroreductase family protein [Muribaculaceae bacterium]|nr:nitroreductase family protein [Muribaculaceae bacterium]